RGTARPRRGGHPPLPLGPGVARDGRGGRPVTLVHIRAGPLTGTTGRRYAESRNHEFPLLQPWLAGRQPSSRSSGVLQVMIRPAGDTDGQVPRLTQVPVWARSGSPVAADAP